MRKIAIYPQRGENIPHHISMRSFRAWGLEENGSHHSLIYRLENCVFVVTLMCLSIGTPKHNKFVPNGKFIIFRCPKNLGRLQPHYNVLEYWDF